MPYTTIVAGNPIQAAWANANVRDQVVTPFASFAALTAAITAPIEGMIAYTQDENRVYVYDGTSWVCITPAAAMVAASEGTTSATYASLTTIGPSVSIRTGPAALVTVSCAMANSTGLAGSLTTVAVSGATSFAASGVESGSGAAFAYEGGGVYGWRSATFLILGMTRGVNTFQMQYRRDTGGTATFRQRTVAVQPLLA